LKQAVMLSMGMRMFGQRMVGQGDC